MNVRIFYKVSNNFLKENIERDLFWYDVLKKEMIEIKGGRLEFEYREDPFLVSIGEEGRKKIGVNSSYRLLPAPKPLEIINYKKVVKSINKEEIDKYVVEYSIDNNIEFYKVDKKEDGFSIDVPDDNVEDFLYQMERRGFKAIIE